MAAELQFRHGATGATMRATVRKEQTVGGKAQLWNGSAWEDMTVANWANYIITLTETPASSYVYIGTMPAVAAGWYYVDIYSGTAIGSAIEATLFGYWDATVLSLGGADARQVSGTVQTPGDLATMITAVGIVGTQVAYAPSTVVRTIGDNDGGVEGATAAHDDSYFSTGENASTGLSVLATRTSSTPTQIPTMLHVTGYYNGSAGHQINVQLWNYALLVPAFETAGVMLSRTSAFDYTFPMSDDNHANADHGNTGEMIVRFVHNTASYNPSHVLHLDYISFDKQVTDFETASSIAAIKSATDQFVFTAGNVHADVQAVLGTTSAGAAGYVGTDQAAIANPTTAVVLSGTTVGTVTDKTGYKLASDGLDSIATTAPIGAASNFREMLVQVWRRFFRRATRTTTEIKTFADNGTTVVTTQTISNDGVTETQGTAT
jgi:hypothetical protein